MWKIILNHAKCFIIPTSPTRIPHRCETLSDRLRIWKDSLSKSQRPIITVRKPDRASGYWTGPTAFWAAWTLTLMNYIRLVHRLLQVIWTNVGNLGKRKFSPRKGEFSPFVLKGPKSALFVGRVIHTHTHADTHTHTLTHTDTHWHTRTRTHTQSAHTHTPSTHTHTHPLHRVCTHTHTLYTHTHTHTHTHAHAHTHTLTHTLTHTHTHTHIYRDTDRCARTLSNRQTWCCQDPAQG